MLNPKELESLNQLEVKLGKKLEELPPGDIWKSTNGYSRDKEGNIIGINLYGAGKADTMPMVWKTIISSSMWKVRPS